MVVRDDDDDYDDDDDDDDDDDGGDRGRKAVHRVSRPVMDTTTTTTTTATTFDRNGYNGRLIIMLVGRYYIGVIMMYCESSIGGPKVQPIVMLGDE